MAERARLESVFTRDRDGGSNPPLSAISLSFPERHEARNQAYLNFMHNKVKQDLRNERTEHNEIGQAPSHKGS